MRSGVFLGVTLKVYISTLGLVLAHPVPVLGHLGPVSEVVLDHLGPLLAYLPNSWLVLGWRGACLRSSRASLRLSVCPFLASLDSATGHRGLLFVHVLPS